MSQKENRAGRPRKYQTVEQLQEAIDVYFQYIEDNPEYKPEMIKGGDRAGTIVNVPHPRMPLKEGLMRSMGICNETWQRYKRESKDGKYGAISEAFYKTIIHTDYRLYEKKMALAAIGTFNHSLIAKEVGLYSEQKIDVSEGLKEVIYEIRGFGRKDKKENKGDDL